MTSNRLDLVVFGATGYTGKYVVKELAKIAEVYPVTWGIAGRNQNKLATLLQDVSKKTGKNLSSIKVIVADVYDTPSLMNMCNQAKVILNCCGPFVKYGEAVVSAAVDTKTHYVDVGAEIKFMKLVEQKYDHLAQASGVYVISACGLLSIPADLGVLFLEQNFDGTLNSVESYLIMKFPPKMEEEGRKNGVIRYSSWESMINSLADVSVKKFKQENTIKTEPALKERFIHKYQDRWSLPFPGADLFVVSKTQRYLSTTKSKRVIQYMPYITFSGIFSAIGALVAGLVLFVLCQMSFTKKFLLKHPRLCSFGRVTYNDTEEGLMDGSCMQYEMIGRGWDRNMSGPNPDKKMVARVSVSGLDPPFVGTAVAAIFSAIAILKEKDKMPEKGGVLSPGVAFKNTSIVNNLKQHDFEFQIIEGKNN